ncbi:unnamed protein product [Ilex paraguariensis]|uniref:Thioredoxin domain-containing protein n=1 Tax=Ilex paraguariensis TaxID=185542 RepID=A0ABC8RZ74_9AQUA
MRTSEDLYFALQFACSVNGDFLDRTLASKWGNAYTSIFFYASWCPFSHDVRSTFEILGSMFPQIEHLAVEQSLAMPSTLSKYGIHSIPQIVLVKQTSRLRFRGSKDLHSLVNFYEKITGYEPVQYVVVDQTMSVGSRGKFLVPSWIGISMNEKLAREPYLVVSILFLCLRVLVFVFPKVVSRFKHYWVSYGPHLNLEIFGETSQMLGRIFQTIDVKRVWTKLRACKTRNFHQGAKSARVWASSLASVSLGETSSSRL